MRITAQKMVVARLLLDKRKTQGDVAHEAGVSRRTLQRMITEPDFIAYQQKVLSGQEREVEAETEAVLKKLAMGKDDAIEALVGIARAEAKMPTTGEKIRAIELLANMLGWMPKPGEVPNPNGEMPEKPDIYQAEWMRKPQ